MEALAASLGLSIAMLVVAAVVASLLFPAFWLWMLIDALIRDTSSYPSGDVAEKVMWVVVMAFLQPVAIVYFFAVWNAGREKRVIPAPSAPAAA